MSIIEKALSILRGGKVMTKVVIKHHDGPMKGEIFVYGRSFTLWPDGSETKVKGGHDLDQVIKDAESYKKEGHDLTITKHYERI